MDEKIINPQTGKLVLKSGKIGKKILSSVLNQDITKSIKPEKKETFKNHFLYPYCGNKRSESIDLLKIVSLDGIKNIIEPFCGSSSISYSIYVKNKELIKDNNINFYLNDNDPQTCAIYDLLKNKSIEEIENNMNSLINRVNNKEEFKTVYSEYKKTLNEHKKGDYTKIDSYKYIFVCKYGFLSLATFSEAKYYRKDGSKPLFKVTDEQKEFINFIKSDNVYFSYGDWYKLFEKYKDDENSLMFFDPPYLQSCNSYYDDLNCKSQNVYEYFYNNDISTFKSKLYFILEKNWIIMLLFGKKIIYEYNKQYKISKKNTIHIVISN